MFPSRAGICSRGDWAAGRWAPPGRWQRTNRSCRMVFTRMPSASLFRLPAYFAVIDFGAFSAGSTISRSES